MKKLVAVLLSLAMLLSMGAAMAELPATFHAEGYPIVDEPVTISVGYMRSANAPA